MEAKFEDVPDEVWKYVEPWLPEPPSHARGGRSRVDDRLALAGIVYRLKTGCQWKAIPRQFGSGSALHRRFQEWAEAGVFHIFLAEMVHYYDDRVGVDRYLRSDNGPEFVSSAILRWTTAEGIETAHIAPGKPWHNGTDESFNGRLREECLTS